MAITLTVTNTFVNGVSTLDATTMNKNFSDVSTWAALFATSTGYVFSGAGAGNTQATITSPASATVATAVINMGTSQSGQGLLLNGAASITGNIFEIDLTPSGTLAMALTGAGGLQVGATAAVPSAGDGSFSRSTTTGAIKVGGTSANGQLDFGIGLAGAWEATTGTFIVPSAKSGNYPNVYAGAVANIFNYSGIGAFACGALGSATVALSYGNTGTASASTDLGSMGSTLRTIVGKVFQLNYNGTPEVTVDTSGNMAINGALSQSSSADVKTNIIAVQHDFLSDILAIIPHRYNFIGEDHGTEPHLGFIAEGAPASLVRGGEAVEPYALTVAGFVAIQQICAKLKAANIAGF